MNSQPHVALSPSRFRYWLRWCLTLAWAGLIFYLSTGTFGGSLSAWLLSQILGFLHLSVSAGTFEVLHFLFRKAAHLTEYGIFGLLIYSSVLGAPELEWRPRTAVMSIVIAGLYSLSDEFHQSFVPGRGPSLKDCGLDTAGAILGVTGLYLFTRVRQALANRFAARRAAAET